ncbi:sigma-E factor negative regulatory protein [Candidatus Nitrotoga sp. 1052]|uniref:sigma-E factor negative regulatory protein n=1 Tax=Candidatus Nitrotoga sp. 1052 TaxID=2886964 RepID=UPI001EF562DD|nr:sigma-E factor negative regulatory protein [Candidatus Nitrotoga sp. 1052]CAH1085473.1 Sigma factor RpoE negative regulatory protein RseA [Candidatus Nitrotoga sp. 1052]
MKQEISALMDGELFDDDAEAVLDKFKRNPDTHEEWRTYHLISDVLRQPDHVHANISIAIRERLQAEPTVLAPRSRASHNVRWFALSAVASVMAFTLVAWLSVQVGSETAPQIAMQQSNAVHSASLPANGLDDYLIAHQEFSPSSDVYGMTSYVHTVARQQEDK